MKISIVMQEGNKKSKNSISWAFLQQVSMVASYSMVFILFYIDCYQFFTYTTYFVPFIITYYSVTLTRVSAARSLGLLLLIGVASLYTHDLFGAQLLPLIPVTGMTLLMYRFIYKKRIIPYGAMGLFLLCDFFIQTYLWKAPAYIHISYVQLCALVGVIWCMERWIERK
jgi:hypothetical protein